MKKGFLILLVFLILSGFSGCSDNKDKTAPKPGGEASVKKIMLLEMNEIALSQILKKNMASEMAANGFVENKDFVLQAKSALGDNANLISLIDTAKKEKPDLLITFQSQALYASIQKAPELKKVFGIVTDPFVLGGGKSDSDHLPNLTGFYFKDPYDKLATLLSKLNPAPKTLGALYLTGDDDSRKMMESLSKALSQKGIKLAAQNYTTQSELTSAAGILFKNKLDGVIKIPDANQDMAFAAIKQLADKAKIPVYSYGISKDNIQAGITFNYDPDQAAKTFWKLTARVLKGEDPAKIPFESSDNTQLRFTINKKQFDDFKIKIPDAVMKEYGIQS